MSDKIQLRISFSLDEEFDVLSDRARELAGRTSDWSGAGSGVRDMGWECDTFEEANKICNAIKDIFPDWKFNIRESTTS